MICFLGSIASFFHSFIYSFNKYFTEHVGYSTELSAEDINNELAGLNFYSHGYYRPFGKADISISSCQDPGTLSGKHSRPDPSVFSFPQQPLPEICLRSDSFPYNRILCTFLEVAAD